MDAGYYISGAGHLGLIGWLLFGGVFRPDPPPFETQEVSIISGAEFDAILAAQRAPDQATDVAQPTAPEITPDAPEVAAAPDEMIEQPQPVQTETPPPDPAPEEVQETPPAEAEVTDAAPITPEPPSEVAVLAPEVAPTPVPREAPRVAPEPVAQPDPEATPDPVEQEAVTPDAEGETSTQEPQEATAPGEATTEIVTEATEAPRAAPNQSPRPPSRRPEAPVPQVAETPSENANDTDAAAIAAAVAAAQSSAPDAPSAPSGPPLSAGEKESLRVAVSSCWNVGSLSSDALQTTVIVTVSMNQDGTPIVGTIQLASSSGGSDAAARQAFEAARRAIIRCGAKGYQLPADKFGQWQNIEMTFNPERMRVK